MILLYILVLTLPFVDWGLLGKEIAGLSLEKLLGAGCLLYALTYLPRRRRLPALFATPQAIAFVAYVVIAVLSYTFTADPFVLKDVIGVFFSQLLFFLIVMILVDDEQKLKNVMLALVASLGIVSLFLIREWVGAVRVYGPGYRPGWVAGDPNMYCASALIVLPLMLRVPVIAERAWQRAMVLGCLALTAVSFLLASSRGGFIGLACMMLVQLRKWSQRIAAVAVMVAIVAICLAMPTSPLDRLLKPTDSDRESSNIRLQLWSASFGIMADHPVFGVGLFNFPKYMHHYLPPNVELDFVVPHNTYLEAAVELGGVGLLTFLAVIGLSLYSFAQSGRIARALGNNYIDTVTHALRAGMVGFAASAMFLSAKHDKLFWFAVFVSACLPALLAEMVQQARAAESPLSELAEAAPAASVAPTVEGPATGTSEGMVPPAEVAPDSAAQPESAERAPIRVGNWLTRH